MLDYAAWARRVSAFVRKFANFPGTLLLSDGLELPVEKDSSNEWLFSDECGLPDSIHSFLTTASARCVFSYSWSPPLELVQDLALVFPETAEIVGGGDLCEYCYYSVMTDRDSVNDLMQNAFENLPPEVSSMFENFRPPSPFDVSLLFGVPEPPTDWWRIMPLSEKSDINLGLQFPNDDGDSPVIMVSEGQKRILSPSFDDFLLDWEQIGYVRPTLKNLEPWIDPRSGRLDVDRPATRRWRSILTRAEEIGWH